MSTRPALSRAAPPGYHYVRGMLVKLPAKQRPAEHQGAAPVPLKPRPLPARPPAPGPLPLPPAAAAPDKISTEMISDSAELAARPPSQPKPRKLRPAPQLGVRDDRYWFVFSPQGDRPSWRHPTPEGAQGEANRLKALHPEADFFVYEARRVGRGRLPEPELASAPAREGEPS